MPTDGNHRAAKVIVKRLYIIDTVITEPDVPSRSTRQHSRTTAMAKYRTFIKIVSVPAGSIIIVLAAAALRLLTFWKALK